MEKKSTWPPSPILSTYYHSFTLPIPSKDLFRALFHATSSACLGILHSCHRIWSPTKLRDKTLPLRLIIEPNQKLRDPTHKKIGKILNFYWIGKAKKCDQNVWHLLIKVRYLHAPLALLNLTKATTLLWHDSFFKNTDRVLIFFLNLTVSCFFFYINIYKLKQKNYNH